MAGYLPDMQNLDIRPVLQAYESGVESARKDQEGFLNKRVGETAANSGLEAASKVAFQGGNLNAGLKLSEMSLDRQSKALDWLARGAQAADTPEKWQQFIAVQAKNFGPDSVKGFEGFSSRESAIKLSMTALQQAELKLQQERAAEQKRQFEITSAGRPEVRTVKDAAGNETLVKISPDGTAKKVDTGVDTSSENPYSSGKQTEAQSKDSLYASRMFNSEKILREVEKVGTSLSEKGKAAIPLVGNYLVSGDYQKYDQAQRDFINATLRRESGAVISDPEFVNARKQYFPQPGDNAETIAQKRKNRQEAITGIASGGGPSYRPPYTFDASGEMIDNKAKPKAVSTKTISSKSEYDKLESGAEFVGSDGKRYRKP